MKSRNTKKLVGLSLLVIYCCSSKAMDTSFEDGAEVAKEASKEQKPATGSVSSLAWDSTADRQDVLKEADVTTVDEARGNWFFKAKILKDARKVYDSIRKKLTKIAPLEDLYAEKRNSIDDTVNIFYHEYGFQQGEADERLNTLLEEVKKLEDSEGALDKDERALLDQLNAKKSEVEAVKLEFNELNKLNTALNQALVTLAGQINRANTYDEQAWQSYEHIELTLSDERAQELLNKIQNNYDNIAAIEKYLKGDFSHFFEKSTKAIDAHVAKIEKKVLALKEQGIGLGKKMAELLAKEEALKLEQEQREREELKKELAEARKTWWDSLKEAVANFFDYIMSFFRSASKVKQPIDATASIEEDGGMNPAPSMQEPQEEAKLGEEEVASEPQEEASLETEELVLPPAPEPEDVSAEVAGDASAATAGIADVADQASLEMETPKPLPVPELIADGKENLGLNHGLALPLPAVEPEEQEEVSAQSTQEPVSEVAVNNEAVTLEASQPKVKEVELADVMKVS